MGLITEWQDAEGHIETRDDNSDLGRHDAFRGTAMSFKLRAQKARALYGKEND